MVFHCMALGRTMKENIIFYFHYLQKTCLCSDEIKFSIYPIPNIEHIIININNDNDDDDIKFISTKIM